MSELTKDRISEIDFTKSNDGLVPAIVQSAHDQSVLMLGYMNEASVIKTLEEGKVVFYSRTKQRLWTKGESSGNTLLLKSMKLDCDRDALLVSAVPQGPTCHLGTKTCWGNHPASKVAFLQELGSIIKDRKINPSSKSYTSSLFAKGINKVAQKVGEEAVELVIEAKDDNTDLFLNEAADLLYHLLILLEAKDQSLDKVVDVLLSRHNR